jgi:hypothetical protein
MTELREEVDSVLGTRRFVESLRDIEQLPLLQGGQPLAWTYCFVGVSNCGRFSRVVGWWSCGFSSVDPCYYITVEGLTYLNWNFDFKLSCDPDEINFINASALHVSKLPLIFKYLD